MNEPNYTGAFHFIVGYIMSANETGAPVTAKNLFQSVYEQYGVLPTPDAVKKLEIDLNPIKK